jgi:hypothetical protein
MDIEAWQRMQEPIQNKVSKVNEPQHFFSGLMGWLVLVLVIWVMIFGCAQIAIWTAGSVEVPDTRSGLTANYGPWETVHIRRLLPDIIEEIRREGEHIAMPLPAGSDPWVADPTATSTPLAPSATVSATVDESSSPTTTPSPIPSSVPAAMPTILPNGGTFTNSVLVTLSCSTTDATIRYTTDGSDPTVNSQVYNEPFVLTSSATVKARAFKAGMLNSDVASATFTITTSGESYVDLVASSLSWSPNPARQGDGVSITFTLRNDGNNASGSFHVRLTRDGAFMCDWDVSSLDAGQVFQRTCSGSYGIPSATPPGHTIEMTVDDQREVAESNEGNNSTSVYVPVETVSSSVDLVPGSITWLPNPVYQGDGVSITFTVRNDGSSGAGGFHVQLSRDGTNMCDWEVTSLGAGQVFQRTCPVSYGIPSASSPGHTIEIIVDDRGEIGESNEGNNSMSVYVPVETVSYSVDLVPGAITWSPDPAQQGDGVSITFTVRNDGSSGAGGFHVQLSRDGTNMCDWEVTSLGAGQIFQRTCPVSYGIPSASSPGHTIEIIVDDQGVVSESNEGNNTRSTFVPVS